MTRARALGLAILVIWIGTVGWHIRREYFRPDLELLALGARSLATGSYFYAVRMGETTIGTAGSRLDTVPGGLVFDDNVVLDIPALGAIQTAVVVTRVELSPALALRAFRFRMDSEIGSFGVSGRAVADTLLDLEIGAGGALQHERVPLTAGTALDPIIPLRMAAAGSLRLGQQVAARIFDPSSLSDREVRIRVTAADTLIVPDSVRLDAAGRWLPLSYDTVPVWRLEQSFGGIVVASWVDQDGILVRAESPLGFTIERTAFELARQERNDTRALPELAEGYGTLIEGTAIASNIRLDDLMTLPALAVRLGGVSLEGFDIVGGRQTLRGDTLLIAREDVAMLGDAGYTLPYRGGGAPADELVSAPLIQVGDPRIVATTREVVGGTTDPALAARRLNDWVYAALRKEVMPSIPSAIQVLEARRGDCNEHTVLFVALARAAGLPARSASGLVHVRGRFYYHAWPEVWLADRWVAVDPTLGQFPADASHLRFLIGGLARQVELVRLIGRLQLEVL